MNLRLVTVSETFEDKEVLKKINEDSFPKEERIELEMLVRLGNKDSFDFKAVYDVDTLVGFYMVVVHSKSVYVFFLAVDENKRSRGYGSAILKLLQENYKEYQIILDLEQIDEMASNNEQRITRKKFYLRNDFFETGYFMKYHGITFEVLCSNDEFDVNDFTKLLEILRNKYFQPRLFQQKIS